jgi:hypothetical protein
MSEATTNGTNGTYEAMNETASVMPPKTADEVARVYEAMNESVPNETVTSTATPSEEARVPPASPPSPSPSPSLGLQGLRLRMKVWTDRATSKRYLMPTAFMRDVVNGQPVSNIMYAYAMRDDDTKLVTLTATEWNSLPFFYFKEDGSAPRAGTRPVDVVG